jgi:hypothetical protein
MKSKTYYVVRRFVRILFWGLVVVVGLLVLDLAGEFDMGLELRNEQMINEVIRDVVDDCDGC